MSDGTCEETAGFLFKHDCPRPALERCAECDKPICERHQKLHAGHSFCVGCAKAYLDQQAGRTGGAAKKGRRSYGAFDDDPYFYAYAHYPSYGYYGAGAWGHEYYGAYDRDDFTEADGGAFGAEGDEAFEQDMGAS